MKFALVLAAAVGLVAAQDFTGQPDCAVPCLRENIPKVGCAITDTGCQCDSAKQSALQPIIIPCLLAACTNAADLLKAQDAAAAACRAYSATAGSGTASASASGSGSGTVAPATTTSASASASASGGSTPQTTTTRATTTSPTTVPTGNVAARPAAFGGAAAAILLGALAL